MQLERAVQKATARARWAEFFKSLTRSFPDLGMHRKAKIVVGADHDKAAAMENSLGSFKPVERLEIGVKPLFHGLFVQVEIETFLKNVHRWTSLLRADSVCNAVRRKHKRRRSAQAVYQDLCRYFDCNGLTKRNQLVRGKRYFFVSSCFLRLNMLFSNTLKLTFFFSCSAVFWTPEKTKTSLSFPVTRSTSPA